MNVESKMAGGASTSNVWTGALTISRSDYESLYDDFIHDGLEGWSIDRVEHEDDKSVIYFLPKKNLVVDSGVHNGLDRVYGLGGGTLITMGVDDGTSNPVAGTSSSSSGSTNRRLVNFDSTPTRAGSTVTSRGTFTNANVSFTIKRLFLSRAAAGTTDVAGDLYAMTNVFTMDFGPFSTWSQTFEASTTGSGS